MYIYMKNVSVIIINYNTAALTLKALQTLYASEPNLYLDCIVIDNNSQNPITKDQLANFNHITYIANKHNVGFARAVNQGMQIAKGDYILLLNSDVFISAGAISKLLSLMDKDNAIGIVGPKMQYPNKTIQVSFGKFPSIFREFMRVSKLGKIFPGGTLTYDNFFNNKYYRKASQVDWVSGGCMLLRREVLESIGFLDARYFFGIEDIDYGYRAKQSEWQVFFEPSSLVTHYHGQSIGGYRSIQRLRYEKYGITYFLSKFKLQTALQIRIIGMFYTMKIWVLKRYYKQT